MYIGVFGSTYKIFVSVMYKKVLSKIFKNMSIHFESYDVRCTYTGTDN